MIDRLPASWPLVSASWLRGRIDDPIVRVCDVRWYLGAPDRGRQEHRDGHLPGAVFVDIETDLATHGRPEEHGRHPLPDAAAFTRRMAELGVGPDHLVVVYDSAGGTVAGRLWWMLDALGYRAGVLDGGLPAWTREGGTLATGDAAPSPVEAPAGISAWPRTIDRTSLRATLGSVTLLDARAANRYRGEVEPVDPVAGHIPTALSAPITEHLDGDQRMLPADRLRARFTELGAAGDDVVVSCGSGVSACHLALAMRVAGLPDPILYAGSYSDWVVSGLAPATGPEPGPPPID